jgi:hypothetical protein
MKVVALAALLLAGLGGVAEARTYYSYPWCAVYEMRTYSCGFDTWEQCRATVSGVGGYCARNPFVDPNANRPRGKQRRG